MNKSKARFLRRSACKISAFSLAALTLCSRLSASMIINSWTPIYQGIDYTTGFESTPNIEQIHAVRIDLTAPGISFGVTPSSAAANPGFETVGQRTADFLTTENAQVAINANFFTTVSDTQSLPQNLFGLSISNGQVVSPADPNYPALTLSAGNVANITTTPSGFSTAGIQNAIAGSSIILQNGVAQNPVGASGDPTNPNPRTAVGVSQSGQYLYLLAVDGRQPGYSNGATQQETGTWLSTLGAYNGLNLDGGGSTTMVRSNGQGGAQLLNSPSDNPQRFDGNNFAVFAQALAAPPPQAYSQSVLSHNPVMYLPLNDPTGSSTAHDQAPGSAHNGSAASSITFGQSSTPIVSQSGQTTAHFPGTSGAHITVPYSPTLNTGSFTIEAWADPTSSTSSAFQAVVSARHDKGSGAAGNNGYILYSGPADNASGDYWQFWTGGTTAQTYNFQGRNRAGYGLGPAVTANQWAFVVGTFSATSGPDANGRYTGTQTLYVNGKLALQLSNVSYLPDPDEPLYIGAGANELNPNDSLDFSGNIGQVAYYDQALSASDIAAQYAAAVPEPATGALVMVAAAGLLMRRRASRSPRQLPSTQLG
jgi:hypothetical protein